MKKYRKALLTCLMILVVSLLFIYPVSALQTYDQRIYKIDSCYQQGCNTQNTDYSNNYYQKRYTNYCPSYNPSNSYQNKNTEYHYYKSYKKDYSWNYYNKKTNTPTTRLSYTKRVYEDTRKSIFGDYVKEYVVEIRNTGDTGRYFSVKFELENKNGYDYIQTVTHYLKGGEKEKFVYRDIQYERHEILDWDYTITPETN